MADAESKSSNAHYLRKFIHFKFIYDIMKQNSRNSSGFLFFSFRMEKNFIFLNETNSTNNSLIS